MLKSKHTDYCCAEIRTFIYELVLHLVMRKTYLAFASGFLILFAALLVFLYFFKIEPKKGDWDKYPVKGIDVSHYQGQIKWHHVLGQDIDFVIIKATEGVSLTDKRFSTNWKALDGKDVVRGAYHFYRPSVKGALQAKHFIKTVRLKSGDLPPVIDFEETDGRSKKIVVAGLKNCIQELKNAYGVEPIIYCNPTDYRNYLKDDFSSMKIWIANYRKTIPKIADGKEWIIWQYSDRGKALGIKGRVDRNVFHGSVEQLKKHCLP